MSDFDRVRSEYWFNRACRQAGLIGGVGACVAMTRDGASPRLTPAEAIIRIGQLLAEFDADTAAQPGGQP